MSRTDAVALAAQAKLEKNTVQKSELEQESAHNVKRRLLEIELLESQLYRTQQCIRYEREEHIMKLRALRRSVAAEAAPEASSAEPLAEEDPEYESYEVFQEKIRRRMDYRGAGGKDDVGKEAGTGNISDPNTTS